MNETQHTLTIRAALAEAANNLRTSGVSEPRRVAGTLLENVICRDRAYLVAHDDKALTDDELARFHVAVSRRANGEPVQYITRRQEFFGLEFEVTPDVLIPRPETELIVEISLEIFSEAERVSFCDVGAGSGCITTALLCHRPNARALALDISESALAVARRNAARHSVADRTRFVASDLFTGMMNTRFDLIVSNPPYISADEVLTLQREVRDHEPRAALTPGADALGVVRRLLADSPAHLSGGGRLLFEIGYGQAEAVRELVDVCVWDCIEVRDDLQGIPRVFVLQLRA